MMVAMGTATGPDGMQKMTVEPGSTLFQAVANFEAQYDGVLRFGILADPEEARYYVFFIERYQSGTLVLQIFPQTCPSDLDQNDEKATALFVGDLLARADQTAAQGK